MTSSDANDLEYYNELLSLLENDNAFDASFEIDAISTHCEVIKNAVQMRIVADLNGVIKERHFYKTESCSLLLRSLELWTTIKAQPVSDQGSRLFKNAVVMVLISTLEELYLFYHGLSQIQSKDI